MDLKYPLCSVYIDIRILTIFHIEDTIKADWVLVLHFYYLAYACVVKIT